MKRGANLLVRKRTVIAASLSLIIFSGTISVLMGIGNAPGTVIGNPDAYIISSKNSAGSLLNSRVDLALSDLLLEQGFVTNASPEIFAFAEINDHAIIIRGVEFDAFMRVEGAKLISGAMPSGPSEGLIGSRLADRLSANVGDVYPLVGSFNPSVSEVRIVGIIQSNSGTDDELAVSLPLARCLAGTSPESVSIIRVLGDKVQLDKIFGLGLPRFTLYDLSLTNKILGIGQTTHLSFKLKNWGDVNGMVDVTVTDEFDNFTLFESEIDVSSDAFKTIEVNCSFSTIGNHSITARLGGTLPQEIQTNISVKGPYLSLIAPRQVAEYHNFSALVINQTLEPVSGVIVSVGGFSYTTNATGRCVINATLAPGNHTMTATSTGYDSDAMSVSVINSSSLSPTALILTYKITLSPYIVKVRENCTFAIYVQNYGNSSGTQSIRSYINGNLFSQKSVTLGALEAVALFYNKSFESAGDYIVTSNSTSVILTVESPLVLNPTLIQLLVRYGGTGTLDPSRADLIYHTTKISEANILIVLISLATLSAVLVTIGISITFMKEINDNLKVVGILRSLGASSRQLLGIIFKEAFLLSLVAAVLGIVGGFILSFIISSSGDLIAFGHLIQPVLDPNFLVVDIAGSVVICVGSSLITGLSVSRRRSIRMIRGLKDDVVHQMTLKELLGDE